MPLQSIPTLILSHTVSPHNLTSGLTSDGVVQSSAGVPVQIVVVVLDVVEVLVELVDVVEVVLVVDVDVLDVDVEVELVLVVDVVEVLVELVDVVEVELVDVLEVDVVDVLEVDVELLDVVVLPIVVAGFKIFLHTSSVGSSPQEVSQYGSGDP